MGMNMKRRIFGLTLVSVATALLVACGGGGGSAAPATNTLSLVPTKGATYGATASAFQSDGKTSLVSGSTSATTGKVDLAIVKTYANPVILTVAVGTSATYYDEKADTNKAGNADLVLASAVAAVTANATAGVTPLTTMAAKLSGINPATVGTASFVAPGKIDEATILEGRPEFCWHLDCLQISIFLQLQ